MTTNTVLVIGIGNTMRGDDGVGPAIVEFLQHEQRLPLHAVARAVHQLTPELAEEVGLARRVVFVDASTRLPPGVVSSSCIAPAESVDLGAHTLTPSMLLAAARSVFGHAPEAILVAVGVGDVSMSETLSVPVRAAVAEAAAAVIGMF